MPKGRPFRERILEKVDMASKDGCWLWLGAMKHGLPCVQRGGRRHPARWAIFEEWTGVEVGPFERVDSRCADRRCVKPEDLFLVDNYHASKLTPDLVREIRQIRKEGWTVPSIARKYEVSKTSIESVLSKRTWANVI